MLELGRKESQVVRGIAVQLAVVGLLVFAYTQAIRQVKHQRGLQLQLQEQLTMAREQMSRQAVTPQLALIQEQVQQQGAEFLPAGSMAEAVGQVQRLAENVFDLQGLQWEKGPEPVNWVCILVAGRDDFEVELVELKMNGPGSSRALAGLLSSAAGSPMLPLMEMELTARPDSSGPPLEASLRWLVPVATSAPDEKRIPSLRPRPAVHPDWGPREEPFR